MKKEDTTTFNLVKKYDMGNLVLKKSKALIFGRR